MKRLAVLATIAVFASPLWAAPQTVTLAVPGMNCPVCPITVKKALMKVDGVSETQVRFEQREAVVTFDDAKASAEALIQATTNAGYPSTTKP